MEVVAVVLVEVVGLPVRCCAYGGADLQRDLRQELGSCYPSDVSMIDSYEQRALGSYGQVGRSPVGLGA